MTELRLSRLELKIMGALWAKGACSIRDILETFPAQHRPAYTTVQTTVYRLERKKALRRVKKVRNFHVFEAAVSREVAQRELISNLVELLGGTSQPVVARLVGSGELTLDDIEEAENTFRKLARKTGGG